MKGYTQLPRETIFFQNGHSISDISLPIFKGNQHNTFQRYTWNRTSTLSWKPKTVDSNEFLVLLNFIISLPSFLTSVCLQVINYLTLSFLWELKISFFHFSTLRIAIHFIGGKYICICINIFLYRVHVIDSYLITIR